ncbi:MAG: Wzz/FepE/Etk N-terminal domain-containing protein [Chloroflexia bacterium]
MELRQYWNVIWKRRWLVLGIVLVASAVSAFMAFTAPRSYETEVKFMTRHEPTPDSAEQQYFTFDTYYNWFASEFLVDDYTQITTSDAFAGSALQTMRETWFAEQVIADLNKQAEDGARPGETPLLRGKEAVDKLETSISKLRLLDVKDTIRADRTHRNLRLTITANDPDVAKGVADAASIVLADAKMKPILGKMVDDEGVFAQIGRAGIDNIQSSRSKEITNAIIRAMMGLVLALALVFLLEYLDDSVRDERDARRVLEMPVLGTIPKL